MSKPTLRQAVEQHLGMTWPRHKKLHCPAHPDKSPSLHLYENTDSYYCFACGATGDGVGLISHFTGQPVGDLLRKFTAGMDYQVQKVKMSPASIEELLQKTLWTTAGHFFIELKEIMVNHRELWQNVNAEWAQRVDDFYVLARDPEIPAAQRRQMISDFEGLLDKALDDAYRLCAMAEENDNGVQGPAVHSEVRSDGRRSRRRVRGGFASR